MVSVQYLWLRSSDMCTAKGGVGLRDFTKEVLLLFGESCLATGWPSAFLWWIHWCNTWWNQAACGQFTCSMVRTLEKNMLCLHQTASLLAGTISSWMMLQNMYLTAVARRVVRASMLSLQCVFAKSQGSKMRKQERRAGHHEGARGPMKSVDKNVFQCYMAQPKTQANPRRTKMAPPKLEVHGGKTGFSLSSLHIAILYRPLTDQTVKVDKEKVRQEEDSLRKSCPSITTDRVFQACFLTFNWIDYRRIKNNSKNIGRPWASWMLSDLLGKSSMSPKVYYECQWWCPWRTTLFVSRQELSIMNLPLMRFFHFWFNFH